MYRIQRSYVISDFIYTLKGGVQDCSNCSLMKGIIHRATYHWSKTAGINCEFENGEKISLIAQLLDSTMFSLRSMNTAQPWVIGGKNNRMFMELLVQIVHVLDVYIAVCMQ